MSRSAAIVALVLMGGALLSPSIGLLIGTSHDCGCPPTACICAALQADIGAHCHRSPGLSLRSCGTTPKNQDATAPTLAKAALTALADLPLPAVSPAQPALEYLPILDLVLPVDLRPPRLS